jgi:hypothetical protein
VRVKLRSRPVLAQPLPLAAPSPLPSLLFILLIPVLSSPPSSSSSFSLSLPSNTVSHVLTPALRPLHRQCDLDARDGVGRRRVQRDFGVIECGQVSLSSFYSVRYRTGDSEWRRRDRCRGCVGEMEDEEGARGAREEPSFVDEERALRSLDSAGWGHVARGARGRLWRTRHVRCSRRRWQRERRRWRGEGGAEQTRAEAGAVHRSRLRSTGLRGQWLYKRGVGGRATYCPLSILALR